MGFKAILILLTVAIAVVSSSQLPGYHSAPQTPANYEFQYAVRDGNDYGHHETRDGDYTQGSYTVQLPDGRIQRVTYTVDGDSGFVAKVTYEGEAQYPAYP